MSERIGRCGGPSARGNQGELLLHLSVAHVGDAVDRYREEARAQRVIGRAFRIFVKRRRLEDD